MFFQVRNHRNFDAIFAEDSFTFFSGILSLSDMLSGPHGQTSAPANEFSFVNMSKEVRHKSCSLHKSIYSALTRNNCVRFDSHSGSAADAALCNVICPGNSSQFCGGDSLHMLHLLCLWVAPVDSICSGMMEPVGNNMPTYTTICFDYFQRDCYLHQHVLQRTAS